MLCYAAPGGLGGKEQDPGGEGAGKQSEHSLQADTRTILRGNFNVELLQRRAHLTAVHRKQQQEEALKSQAPGGVLQSRQDRRRHAPSKSNSSSQNPSGGHNQSIFQKKGGKNEVKSFLDDYLPPKNFRVTPQEAKEKWKSLSDLESGKTQGVCVCVCIIRFLCVCVE